MVRSIRKQAKLMGFAGKSSLSQISIGKISIFTRVSAETTRKGTGTEGKFMSTETTTLAIGKTINKMDGVKKCM